MIVGIGSDLCDINRIARALARFGEAFTARLFTPAEQARAGAGGNPAQAYARRFAAKEACAKALGTGLWQDGVFFCDIGVISLPGGQPVLQLTGGARQRLLALMPPGHRPQLFLSMSDEPPLAQAFVVIEAVLVEPLQASG